MNPNECDNLDRIISRWPGVSRRQEQSQIVFSTAGTNFCWLSPGIGMVQLRPPLGRNCVTRRLEREENEVRVIRQKTGQIDALYHDPGSRLTERWSYPGFMCPHTPVDEALDLIRQAYENLKRDKTMHSQQESLIRYSSSEKAQAHDTHKPKVTVTRIESLCRLSVAGEGLLEHPSWLSILVSALEELPKGCQGEKANELLADALIKAGVRLQREVTVSPGSGHSVDFRIIFNGDRVGVELGTVQAERLELDLLKLISLALRQEINYACLILPQNVTRPSVFGTQGMPPAVKSLARMCSPILTLIQAQLKDTIVIWYA